MQQLQPGTSFHLANIPNYMKIVYGYTLRIVSSAV